MSQQGCRAPTKRIGKCRCCGAPLGTIRRDGAMSPLATVGAIDRMGIARVACLDCDEVGLWHPLGRAPAGRVVARAAQTLEAS